MYLADDATDEVLLRSLLLTHSLTHSLLLFLLFLLLSSSSRFSCCSVSWRNNMSVVLLYQNPLDIYYH